ncbi:MAG: hypothetical protein PHG00_11515, partial [Methylococcales bacterium]|nr:hypothetical protein [Methylococcales bacterium]
IRPDDHRPSGPHVHVFLVNIYLSFSSLILSNNGVSDKAGAVHRVGRAVSERGASAPFWVQAAMIITNEIKQETIFIE